MLKGSAGNVLIACGDCGAVYSFLAATSAWLIRNGKLSECCGHKFHLVNLCSSETMEAVRQALTENHSPAP